MTALATPMASALPVPADVRMMAFGLSEFADLLDKGPCFAKAAEPEGPLDTMSVVAEFPVRGLRTEAFGFLMSEWWDATTAGRACFLGKSFGHVSLSLIKLFARHNAHAEYLSFSAMVIPFESARAAVRPDLLRRMSGAHGSFSNL
jgi:hypothetical protein